jgi:hypothetical protein
MGISQAKLGRLLGRSQIKPSGRPPALLLRRAFDGYQKGVISVRPLAGLVKQDPTDLLTKLTESEGHPDAVAYLESPQVPREEALAESDEELFSGNPV